MDLAVWGAVAQQHAQIVAVGGEQAGVELAFGGEARSRAVPTKGLRDRGDDADFARAVLIAPALGDFPAVIRVRRLERRFGVDHGDDLARRDDVIHAPAVGVADIHVLNETQDMALFAEETRHRQDAVFVESALDDHVDLDRCEPGCGRGLYAVKHPGRRKVDVVHAHEHLVVQRIEAYGHALEARLLQCAGLLLEKGAVGGQGQIEAGDRGEHGDQLFQIAPDQRLAPRQADFLDSELSENARKARNLFECQQFFTLEELVILAEHFLRHAIDAAEVAAIGDRDAQVTQRTAQPVATVGRNLGGNSG